MAWDKSVVHKSLLPHLAQVTIPGAVFLKFCLHGDQGTGENAYPSLKRMAEDLGVTVRSVQRAVRELAAAGLLVHTGNGKNRTRRYTVVQGASNLSHPSPRPRKPKCVKSVAPGASNLSSNQIPSPDPSQEKICTADAARVAALAGEIEEARSARQDQEAAPPPAVSGKIAWGAKPPTSLQALTEAVANGDKSELWSAIAATGIRLKGRQRFRLVAQEDNTRQACAYLLEQAAVRRWPSDPAAFLVWAWKNLGGRGAEALSRIRKQHATTSGVALRVLEQAMDEAPASQPIQTHQASVKQPDPAAAALDRLVTEQRLRAPMTPEERELQARLDAELARRRA